MEPGGSKTEKCPYRWFRYTLLVPTVARVHFLHLKPLVCIPISTGSTWDIVTKNRCVIPQGFGSRMCTLTIPTICTIDTVTKLVSRIKQWRDSHANNGPILKIISEHKFCHKKNQQMTTRRSATTSRPPPPQPAAAKSPKRRPRLLLRWRWHWCGGGVGGGGGGGGGIAGGGGSGGSGGGGDG